MADSGKRQTEQAMLFIHRDSNTLRGISLHGLIHADEPVRPINLEIRFENPIEYV